MLNPWIMEELQRMRRKIDGISGSGGIHVQHTAHGINIYADPQKPVQASRPVTAESIDVQICRVTGPVSYNGTGYNSICWATPIVFAPDYEISSVEQLACLTSENLQTSGQAIFVNTTNNSSWNLNNNNATPLNVVIGIGVKVSTYTFTDTYPQTNLRGVTYPVYMGPVLQFGSRFVLPV